MQRSTALTTAGLLVAGLFFVPTAQAAQRAPAAATFTVKTKVITELGTGVYFTGRVKGNRAGARKVAVEQLLPPTEAWSDKAWTWRRVATVPLGRKGTFTWAGAPAEALTQRYRFKLAGGRSTARSKVIRVRVEAWWGEPSMWATPPTRSSSLEGAAMTTLQLGGQLFDRAVVFGDGGDVVGDGPVATHTIGVATGSCSRARGSLTLHGAGAAGASVPVQILTDGKLVRTVQVSAVDALAPFEVSMAGKRRITVSVARPATGLKPIVHLAELSLKCVGERVSYAAD